VEFYPTDSTFYAGGLDDFQLQANTLGELGGRLIPFLTDRSYFDEPFSIENLGELDRADAILLVAGSDADHTVLDGVELWQRLPAVAAGRVVHTDIRTNQGSVFAATECLRLLDQLYTLIG
jgi:iron complex transport system substrate-binding protein